MAAANGDYPRLSISFGCGDTPDAYCTSYPERFHEKFTAPHPRTPEVGAYENGASILVLPSSYEEYWHNGSQYTRRRVRRALKLGYEHSIIDRNEYLDDIYAINTSMNERQGRKMDAAYLKRPKPFGRLPAFTCPRHQLVTFGVTHEGHLVAYSWVYQMGEMCLFSTILGHGDHLEAGIMFLLVAESMHHLMDTAGLKYSMYNMHFSGSEGLRFFKERVGFQPFRVNWCLADADLPADRSAVPVETPAAE